MSMKISTREKRFLMAGGFAVVAFLATQYGIGPFTTSQLTVRQEIQEKQALLERYQLMASQKDRYQRRVEGLKAQLRQVEALQFAREKLPLAAAEIQGLLHKLGQEAGIKIVRENVPPPKKVEIFTQVTVELSVQGDSRAIRDFLYKIQTAPKLLTVPRIIIRGLTSYGPTPLSADIQVAGYTLGGEEKGPVASPASEGKRIGVQLRKG